MEDKTWCQPRKAPSLAELLGRVEVRNSPCRSYCHYPITYTVDEIIKGRTVSGKYEFKNGEESTWEHLRPRDETPPQNTLTSRCSVEHAYSRATSEAPLLIRLTD